MEFDDDNPPVVCDNGAYSCKVGLAGEDVPRARVPCQVGHLRIRNPITGRYLKERYVGLELQDRREMLSLSYPIQNAMVRDWEDMESIWEYAFESELRIDPSKRPILLTEAHLNPKSNREKMVQSMFETFRTPGTYIAAQSTLALYSSGRVTGLVAYCGHDVTEISPIYDGFSHSAGVSRYNLGGTHLTDYLINLLADRKITRSVNRATATRMKNVLAYIAYDYDAELIKAAHGNDVARNFLLPDGQMISVSKERFSCMEPLFCPSLLGLDFPGVHKAAFDGVMNSQLDCRREMLENIVVAGACTLSQGFGDRLVKEIRAFVPNQRIFVRVVAPPERADSVWIGGSILASLTSFQPRWILKEEYEEFGTSIIHRKLLER